MSATRCLGLYRAVHLLKIEIFIIPGTESQTVRSDSQSTIENYAVAAVRQTLSHTASRLDLLAQ